MHEEILKAKGRLAECKRKRSALSLEGKGLVVLLRNVLDPYEPDLARLRIPEARENMNRLAVIQEDIRLLDDQIDTLSSDLGHADG